MASLGLNLRGSEFSGPRPKRSKRRLKLTPPPSASSSRRRRWKQQSCCCCRCLFLFQKVPSSNERRKPNEGTSAAPRKTNGRQPEKNIKKKSPTNAVRSQESWAHDWERPLAGQPSFRPSEKEGPERLARKLIRLKMIGDCGHFSGGNADKKQKISLLCLDSHETLKLQGLFQVILTETIT